MKKTDVKRLFALGQKIKTLNKELEQLKVLAKQKYGHLGKTIIDDIELNFIKKSRTNTDLESLTAEIGIEKIAEYQSVTQFIQMNIKKVS